MPIRAVQASLSDLRHWEARLARDDLAFEWYLLRGILILPDNRQFSAHEKLARQATSKARGIGRWSSAIAAAASTLLYAAPGGAGTIGGTMGNVSRATIGITLSVAPRIELLRAGPQSTNKIVGASSMRTEQPLCIWGNTALGTYTLTALRETSKDNLSKDGSGNRLAYKVGWESPASGSPPISFSNGSTISKLNAAKSIRCGGAATAGLVVDFPDAVESQAEGNGLETLVLLIAPD
jgi:hypothetical protein